MTPQVELDAFYLLSREAFDYLVTDFGFSVGGYTNPPFPARDLDFDSQNVQVSPFWDRGWVDVGIWVKIDTFWIRPNSPRSFKLTEFIKMFEPARLASAPNCESVEFTEAELRPAIFWCAEQLRSVCTPLLHGDVTICEDLLITRTET